MLRPFALVSLRAISRWMGFRWNRWAPLFLCLCFDFFLQWVLESWGWRTYLEFGRSHYVLAVGGGMLGVELFHQNDQKKQSQSWSYHLGWHLALSVGSWLPVAAMDLYSESFVSVWTPIWSGVTVSLFCQWVYPLGWFVMGLDFLFPVNDWIAFISETASFPVSYTHLTLPTNYSV